MTLIFCFLILLFMALIISAIRNQASYAITETTTHQSPVMYPLLDVQSDHGQPFVIDPADGSKTWINSHDNFYEDAVGKIWELN